MMSRDTHGGRLLEERIAVNACEVRPTSDGHSHTPAQLWKDHGAEGVVERCHRHPAVVEEHRVVLAVAVLVPHEHPEGDLPEQDIHCCVRFVRKAPKQPGHPVRWPSEMIFIGWPDTERLAHVLL